jgi:hypothetical protein
MGILKNGHAENRQDFVRAQLQRWWMRRHPIGMTLGGADSGQQNGSVEAQAKKAVAK